MTLARNALLNLAGHAAPLAAAILLVPPLVERLGTERFGFLALAWVLVGYLSLLDLGLSRALTRLVAQRADGGRDLGALSREALSLTLLIGILAGAVLFAAAAPLSALLGLAPPMQAEGARGLRVLALCLPAVTVTAALRGILEGRHLFGWVNVIRIPVGVMTFAAPLIAAWWTVDLAALTLALALIRAAALIAHWLVCRHAEPGLTGFQVPSAKGTREMLAYGGWLTVSNVVGPLMVYIDRFVIGAVLTVSAVAFYTAPYEVVTRLWLVPAALSAVLFPAMASASPERLAALYRIGVKLVLAAIFPLALLIIAFAHEGLRVWLGERFAAESTRVGQLLCLGTAVNSLAYLPFTLLQARGRSDLTAKVHLAELPLYFGVLGVAVWGWGIEGAAFAWAARCMADALALFLIARGAPGSAPAFTSGQCFVIVAALIGLAAAIVPDTMAAKVSYVAVAMAVFSLAVWGVLLDQGERSIALRPWQLLAQRRDG